jgi:hypothetical protein
VLLDDAEVLDAIEDVVTELDATGSVGVLEALGHTFGKLWVIEDAEGCPVVQSPEPEGPELIHGCESGTTKLGDGG